MWTVYNILLFYESNSFKQNKILKNKLFGDPNRHANIARSTRWRKHTVHALGLLFLYHFYSLVILFSVIKTSHFKEPFKAVLAGPEAMPIAHKAPWREGQPSTKKTSNLFTSSFQEAAVNHLNCTVPAFPNCSA